MKVLHSLSTALRLDAGVVRQALALALAAWLSFAIASSLQIANPYWAAMPVWVIAQASRGLVVERAAFRIVGTLIGAAAGFALVHLPAPPFVQLALLAGWVALAMGLTHVLRGVQGYGALLAGMTAAIVAIPSLLDPSESTHIAAARVACTLIGVVAGTLVLAWLTPDAALDEFYARIRAVAADALGYAARMIRHGGAADDAEERRILSLVSSLESSARLTSAGSVRGYRRLADVDLLVVGSLSAMAAAQALAEDSGAAAEAGADRVLWLEQAAARLRTAAPDQPAHLARDLDAGGGAGAGRLERAVTQILDADAALHGRDARPGRDGRGGMPRLAPHREWAIAWGAGAVAGVATFAASALALWANLPSLQLAAIGVCIFGMVLGSMPLPQLIAPKLLTGVVVGVTVAIGYRVVVQPGLATHAGLLLTIAPFLLVGGFARAHPRTTIAAVDANMCFLLASQAGMPPTDDVGRIVADALALALSAAALAGGFMLLPRRAERQARDAAALIRRDLARMLERGEAGRSDDWQGRGGRQILRLTLHLGRADVLGERGPGGLLAVLNLGQSLIELRRQALPEAATRVLAAMLQQQLRPDEAARMLRGLADSVEDRDRAHVLCLLAARTERAAGLLSYG